MAKARKTASQSPRRGKPRAPRAAPHDAIALLKADHRQVEEWFAQFETTRAPSRREELARKICHALMVHTQIEEEIFYPAFLEATAEEDIHHEAEVEHEGAKKLIAEIEGGGPEDEYFQARVTVLSEMVQRHVREEEKRDGMFGKARQAEIDLVALGEQLDARKTELMEMGNSKGNRGPRSVWSGAGASLAGVLPLRTR